MTDKKLLASLLTLSSVVELRDPYTGGHLWRVGSLSRLVAEAIGLDAEGVFLAGLGGFLHDLGKIGVPDAILRKAGPLSADELAVIKTHPTMGAELLGDHPLAHAVVDAVLSHHERPDGSGYPRGLHAEQVPLVARIVGVADAFDAMTSTRSYRPGMPIERALAIVEEERGRQFDTPLADALAALHGRRQLEHIVGHSDHGRPLAVCPNCGPIVAVPRVKDDGDAIFCRNCGGEYRLHRNGDAFALEPIGSAPDPSVLRPVPESDVFPEFFTGPRAKSSFFFGRISSLLSRQALLGGAAAVAVAAAVKPASAQQSQVPANASLDWLFGARDWINGPLSRDALRGKVVLVDVFTFDCINCKNITPNLRKLARAKVDDGLAIVGIHSPETAYEHDRGEVVRHLRELGITWPVAIDNDFALWKRYDIAYWPTQMLFDRRGKLRTVVIGDSQDAAVDAAVDRLLRERAPVVDGRLVLPPRAAGSETVWATIELTPQPGWHLYARDAGERAPQIAWHLPAGIEAGAIVWPEPTRLTVGGTSANVYAGRVALRVPLTISSTPANANARVRADVSWAACAHVCVTGRIELEATLLS